METTELNILPEVERKQRIQNTGFLPGTQNGKLWLNREEALKSRSFYCVLRRGQDIFFSLLAAGADCPGYPHGHCSADYLD